MKSTKQVPVAEFKSQCLSLFEIVRSQKEKMTITRRGKPIAQIIPYQEQLDDIEAQLANSLVFEGDLISPINEEWEACK
jgi:prevent-host-death family protein